MFNSEPVFTTGTDGVAERLAALREQALQEHEARGGRRLPRRVTMDELATATAEAREVINQAWTVSRVLRAQLARYEQLVKVDSWRDVVTVAIPGAELAELALDGADLAAYPEAACGHRRGAGECDCPEAGQ